MSRKVLLAIASALCLAAAGGVVTWWFWPPPPPTTAAQVIEAVMKGDPAELSEKELEVWIADVAAKAERLPPHELQKLVEKALADEGLRERFESLSPEQRAKMAALVSEEQRARMMAKMATGFVAMLKAMPPPLRKVTIEQTLAKRDTHERVKGREMTKDRVAQWLAATTPTQRAEMVRAMREMRTMMREAGIKE